MSISNSPTLLAIAGHSQYASADWANLAPPYFQKFIAGAVSLRELSDGIQPYRLRWQDEKFIHPGLLGRTQISAGIHLRFVTDSERLLVKLTTLNAQKLETTEIRFDLCVDGKFAASAAFGVFGPGQLQADALPAGNKTIDLYFPTNAAVVVHEVGLSAGSIHQEAEPRKKWITHGSSITQCRAAAGPAFAWPAIVARNWQWDHWNMGYGGQCKMDQIVARTIAKMPADRISLCLGINTVTLNYTERTWTPAMEGFIFTVRDHHPVTPLLIISPILSPPRETFEDKPCHIPLQLMREKIAKAVEKFQEAGDQNIYYLSGLEIIGPGDESTMPDALHPDADGIKLMAERFIKNAPRAWSGT